MAWAGIPSLSWTGRVARSTVHARTYCAPDRRCLNPTHHVAGVHAYARAQMIGAKRAAAAGGGGARAQAPKVAPKLAIKGVALKKG